MPMTFYGPLNILQLFLIFATSEHVFLNQFAVQLKNSNRRIAQDIARDYFFLVKTEIACLGAFILENEALPKRSKRSATYQIDMLKKDSRIQHVQQEVILHRVKRRPPRSLKMDNVTYRDRGIRLKSNLTFSDPKFKDMSYLVNEGQAGDDNLDINIAPVWESGFTGKGVVVAVLDDGIDYSHPDLANNYDPRGSTDLNDKNDIFHDPMPNRANVDNSHGTRCAGEIAAAANNDVCGLGVAYEANIAGIRLLDGVVTDSLEAEALTFNHDYIDVYSASWGPSDNGIVMTGPGHLTVQAFQYGVAHGRRGLGSIFVWATGNGGQYHDNCNADGYVSRPETLAVGVVDGSGKSPFYSENCTSILLVVPSGVDNGRSDKSRSRVITTDINGGCAESFEGTSSAAPLVAGCIANVLQANSNLTWRDIQHIAVQAARIPSVDDSWTINGAGLHVSHQYGFGLLDCGRMVHLAQSWDNVLERRVCELSAPKMINRSLHRLGKVQDIITVDDCPSKINQLEHVQIDVKMWTEYRGDILITLTSPSLTRSVLLAPRPRDSFSGKWEFTFMTVHNWDENPAGDWIIDIQHNSNSDNGSDTVSEQTSSDQSESSLHSPKTVGEFSKIFQKDLNLSNESEDFIYSWNLILWGTYNNKDPRSFKERKAFHPTSQDLEDIKKKETQMSRNVVKAFDTTKTSSSSTVEKKAPKHDNFSNVEFFNLKLKDNIENTESESLHKRILETQDYQDANNDLDEIETLTDNITETLTEILNSK